MAPRTAAAPSLDDPPKRMTRARAARTTEAPEAPARTSRKDTAADKPAAPTRGRPRTKTTSTCTDATASKPIGRSAAARNNNTATAEPKKDPAKRGRKKAQDEVQDTSAIDPDSSEDEMDIVSVRARPKSVTSSNKTATAAPKSAPGRGRKMTLALMAKGHDESAIEDNSDNDDELAQPEIPKKRPGRPKVTSTATKGKAAATETSTKAPVRRSRKATSVAADDENKGDNKTIHISAASLTASSAASRAKTTTTAPPRKKVTFLDMATDADKENKPIPSPTATEPKNKIQMGVKDKPVRKGAATPEGQKPTGGSKEEKKKEPLSPKKATQVARSGSSASSRDSADDDESGSPRPRIPRHSGSPTKRDPPRSFDSPVKKIDFTSPVKPSSQHPSLFHGAPNEQQQFFPRSVPATIPADSIMLASPARRLPPSPLKESLRDSPRRAQLQPAALLSRTEVADPRENSPLKTSPKKGKLGAAFPQRQFNPTATPSKTKMTLLQSPAKRPLSPIKSLPSRNTGVPPSREAPSERTEETIPYHVRPSPSTEKQQESITKSTEQDIKKEPETDDVFTDGPLDVEMSVLEDDQPSTAPGENVCSPVVQEETGEEPPAEAPTYELDDPLTSAVEDVYSPVVEEEDGSESPMKTPAYEIDDPFIITEANSIPTSPVNRYEIVNPDTSVSSIRSYQGIPPAAPSPPVFTASKPSQFVYRDDVVEDSEDEQMADASPTKFNVAPSRRKTIFGAQATSSVEDEHQKHEESLGFTPLAQNLSQWDSISPVKRRSSRVQSRGIFSPQKRSEPIEKATEDAVKDNGLENEPQPRSARQSLASITSMPTFFEDAMSVRQRDSVVSGISPSELDETDQEIHDDNVDEPTANCNAGPEPAIYEDMEDEGEAYGDENAVPAKSTAPIDPRLFDETPNEETIEKENSIPLPMSVTPIRSRVFPRTVHTVSKVPLRPDGDGSTLKIPRKRTRSLSSSPRKSTTPCLRNNRSPLRVSPRKERVALKPTAEDIVESEPESELPDETPVKYSTSTWPKSAGNSPTKSSKKPNPKDEQVLQGAVVFADVHTAEGADASGIFVELLTQMGARCVKSWSWNPRTSLSPVDGVDPKESKVGITHVVFKDGGVRTLEKVREANGLVKCVGVSWVLDCERKGKWLDESDYGVDVSLVPRGGQKRRKSMEPRALSNMNGSIIKLDSSTSSNGGRRSGADRETFQELMRVSPFPSSSRRDSMEWERASSPSQPEPQRHFAIQSTPTNPSRIADFLPGSGVESPTTPDFNYAFDFDGASAPSPITPYYPSQGSKLVQQTCPPKQLRQGLFDDQGRGDSQLSEGLKIRLEAARRKSLVWKPKVGSPLAGPGLNS
ncbi:hypothetical protein AJ79_04219 [Helicocarpus griseus UAMH5409]|uniref:BRCT domain-containing protein n=1 Tax=Helicocarpus griseus UAMH5409 TaxID=1447875 RepID=A0A2B7XU59_9EURO|nr:hypothetical protein AJ79_04219 [Helicocarpus griseus UAMH5409]